MTEEYSFPLLIVSTCNNSVIAREEGCSDPAFGDGSWLPVS